MLRIYSSYFVLISAAAMLSVAGCDQGSAETETEAVPTSDNTPTGTDALPTNADGTPYEATLSADRSEAENPATVPQYDPTLRGSIIADERLFGGGPEFTDDDLRQTVALLPDDIEIIELKMTQISDAGLAHLKDRPNITQLYLPKQITDAGLKHLAVLAKLEVLNLESGSVYGTGLGELKNQKHLRRLYLNESSVTDDGLAALKNFAALEELDLTGTSITDAGLAHLKDLPNLTSLDVSVTQVSRKAAQAFQEARPSVVVLGP